MRNLGDVVGSKVLIVIRTVYAVTDFIIRKIGKKQLKNLIGSLGVAHIAQRHDFFL